MTTTLDRTHTHDALVPPVSPPCEEEMYWYFGRQHKWFVATQTVAGFATIASLTLFSVVGTALWLFWIPLSIFAIYLMLTCYTTTRRRRVDRPAHEMIVRNWRPVDRPTVDVFLPCAGEELDVLANTYRFVSEMEYDGRLSVYVLDDSARDEVRSLAEARGFTYLTRPDRGRLKKAGNLKFGYDHTDGDFIVIFDADFCPRPDFLAQLMPYFGEDVAIVQSPQFFDTHRGMHWLQRCAGSVQESFYRWGQVARDALGAPICVGTNAIYRRAALQRSGGFAQIGHSEDVHTGVNLMKAGFRTVYVPIIVAKGLCPDKLSSFISQQYRWCAGSMSLLNDKEFHDSPLDYRQRLCFFTGFGYYICTAVGVLILPLPTIIMLWMQPERVHLSNFFWMLPALLSYPAFHAMHRSGYTLSDLRVTTISSFSHAAAILDTLLGRTADWVPSGEAKKTSMTSKVTTVMVLWTLGTDVLTAAGATHFLINGYSRVDVAPVFFFLALHLAVVLPIAKLAWTERVQRRSAVRPAERVEQIVLTPPAASTGETTLFPAVTISTESPTLSPVRSWPRTELQPVRLASVTRLPLGAAPSTTRQPRPGPTVRPEASGAAARARM